MSPPPACPVPRLPGTTSPCLAAPGDQGTAEAAAAGSTAAGSANGPTAAGVPPPPRAWCHRHLPHPRLKPQAGPDQRRLQRLPRHPPPLRIPGSPAPRQPPGAPTRRPLLGPRRQGPAAGPGAAALIPGLGWGQGLQHAAVGRAVGLGVPSGTGTARQHCCPLRCRPLGRMLGWWRCRDPVPIPDPVLVPVWGCWQSLAVTHCRRVRTAPAFSMRQE